MRCSSCAWNVAGRKTRLDEQAARVLGARAGPGVPSGGHAGDRGGGGSSASPRPASTVRWRHCRRRARAAGRWPCSPPRAVSSTSCSVADVPWPERVLAARAGGIEIVNVHSPISPKPGLAKVLTHEAVFRHLRDGSGPRIVLGDLNTPRKEHPDGSVWTFAREQVRPPPAGPRRALGRRRVRADPRPRAERLPRRLPRAERLRAPRSRAGNGRAREAATASTT